VSAKWVVDVVVGLVFVAGERGGEHLVLSGVYHLGFDLAVDFQFLIDPALR
jgi:hypothetical protein